MKKTAALILVFAALFICIYGCSPVKRFDDLSQINKIEIRVHSLTDQTYEDIEISDIETVRKICDTFSSLEMKKYKTDKPLMALYELSFFESGNKKAAESVYVTASGGVCDGEDLYTVTNGINIIEHLAEIIPNKE